MGRPPVAICRLRMQDMMLAAVAAAGVILQAITFTNVAQGQTSQIDEARRVVIRTDAEFQALWKMHSQAPIPKVDFSKSLVVGVFMGMRPTAGYRVTVTAVRRTPKGAVVEYTEAVPDKDRMVAQMLTSPFHLVAIPRDVELVEFLKTN